MPMPKDLVSTELRAAEKEIDEAFRANPLTRLPFPEAAWYYLAACEEVFIAPIVNPDFVENEFLHRALADNVINRASWS